MEAKKIVEEAKELEVGFIKIKLTNNSKLFEGISNNFYTFNYHWDIVTKVPRDFEVIAVSDMCNNHIMKHKTKPIFGLQFHIEYDEKTSIPVLEYLKDEIIAEEINYDEILKNRELFNKETINKLIENFLKIALR